MRSSGRKTKQWQTNVVISIFGQLRDRKIEETIKETKEFISQLTEKLYVKYATCTVDDYKTRYDCIGDFDFRANFRK